jgi:Concanavalin A-like lectin/glucanases superfamily
MGRKPRSRPSCESLSSAALIWESGSVSGVRRVSAGVVAALVLLVVCMAGPVNVASAAGAEPLRGQWHLDESCAEHCVTFADSSGNGLTGVGTGNVAHVADGKFGGAQAFPTKSESVNVGNSSLLQPSTITLLAWVRATSTPFKVKTVAAQGADGSCGQASYALYTGGSRDASGLRFYIWNGTAVAVSPAADNAMWDGKWHLAAGTYDGATVRLYVDGTEVGSGTPASGSIGYGLAGNNNFTIGNYGGASECVESTNFSGDIDEVRVYSRALTATEIGRLAASTGPTPPDLIPDTPAAQPPVRASRRRRTRRAWTATRSWRAAPPRRETGVRSSSTRTSRNR